MAANSRDSRELKTTLAAIQKEFGEGAIMSLGEFSAQDIEGIPTGSLGLDLALGGKGIPRGRIVEIYGAESSGKTTIALHCIANVQKMGGVAAFIDAEHALDPSWAKRIGVDLESLLVSQPSYGEEGLRIAEMLVKSNAVDLIVIDSVAALVPKNELNNDIGDSSVGQQARLMSQALRMLNPTISKTRTCIIFINQIRQKIGVLYGNPETTTGGLALKFYASVRLEVRKSTMIKDGDEPIGSECKVKVVKNKIAPPFRTAEFSLMHDRGIDLEEDVLKIAVEEEVVTKSGAFFSYKEQRLGQGKENAKTFLRDTPTIRDTIIAEVLAKHAATRNGEALPASEDDPAELAEAEAPAPTTTTKKRGKAAASE
ncbi:MAG: recombinase RecA [Bacteroidales bacterium]|nr:recombinase RecA [Bacteroidales bacterium]